MVALASHALLARSSTAPHAHHVRLERTKAQQVKLHAHPVQSELISQILDKVRALLALINLLHFKPDQPMCPNANAHQDSIYVIPFADAVISTSGTAPFANCALLERTMITVSFHAYPVPLETIQIIREPLRALHVLIYPLHFKSDHPLNNNANVQLGDPYKMTVAYAGLGTTVQALLAHHAQLDNILLL
jgi:hypothetical protein